MSEVIKSYKGFDKNLQCHGFQYEIGKEYEEPKAIACNAGFHACERPLDVFNHYVPANNRFCKVEQSGDFSRGNDDSKVASTRIKIGAEIGIPGLVKAQIEYVKSRCTNECNAEAGKPATAGNRGAATAGDYGAATAGVSGAATAGDYGAATAGDYGAATAGDYGAATAGDSGAATAGNRGAATAGVSGAATAGDSGAATAGNRGAATAGDSGAATSRGTVCVGANGAGLVRGSEVKIKGGIGAVLVIVIENDDDYGIKEWKTLVVNNIEIKEDTWYTLQNGEVVETE